MEILKELWDLYDKNRIIIGEHTRGLPIPNNVYHLVIHAWIRNNDGKYLMSKRSSTRSNCPSMWECVGGSVLKGESSIDGALREIKEEVGLSLSNNDGILLFSKIREYVNEVRFGDILDVYLFHYDGKVLLENATTNEVDEVLWLSKEEILSLYKEKKLVNTLDYFFEIFN